ncbi:MAG: FAD-dependent oxidoreductase, partial [Proteobacteria bacterium]|nr:FAD-dependent oxidoreductase [Pseudomonadota bacterium]
ARLGGLHRNTFLNSPKLLDNQLRLKSEPRLRFAGQITGVEGYIESAAMGLLAGRFAAAEILGQETTPPPGESAHGALIYYITGGHMSAKGTFQPMNITFGLMPDLNQRLKKKERKPAKAKRALEAISAWASKY